MPERDWTDQRNTPGSSKKNAPRKRIGGGGHIKRAKETKQIPPLATGCNLYHRRLCIIPKCNLERLITTKPSSFALKTFLCNLCWVEYFRLNVRRTRFESWRHGVALQRNNTSFTERGGQIHKWDDFLLSKQDLPFDFWCTASALESARPNTLHPHPRPGCEMQPDTLESMCPQMQLFMTPLSTHQNV